MPRSLLPLAFVLAFVAAACADATEAQVDMGSGVRFVPTVADALNDAGRYASVSVGPEGLPVVAYFGFQEELQPGDVPPTRPVGTPSLPSVMLATVSQEGYWTHGAVAMAESIPNVTVPFNPALEASVAELTPQDVTGLSLVGVGDTYHAAWASSSGIYHATGSLDPAGTTQATVSQVTNVAGVGLSLAVDGDGTPWIAFYTSASAVGTVDLATPDGEGWQVDPIAVEGGCDQCRTSVIAADDGVAVAYASPSGGVQIARNDGENGWVSFEVAPEGGGGLSGTATAQGFALSFYDQATVVVATGPATGPFDVVPAAGVDSGDGATGGSYSSIAADDAGTLWLGWHGSVDGVGFASGDGEVFTPIETGGATSDGAFPSVAVVGGGSTAYLAWYATEQQDLMVGGYGDIGEVPVALPSPTSSEPVEPPAPPQQECTPVEGGTVTVVAEGIAFTDGSCIEATVGEAFTISFDNRDSGAQHNVQIYTGPEPSGDLLFEGEIITGPAQIDYQVPAFQSPGDYAYICIVHPNMVGRVQVVEPGGGDGEAAAGLTVTAVNIAFDTSTIELAAGEATTASFLNEDSGVQHNIAIYQDDTLAVELFNGELITGPAEIVYEVPPLEAGEYYFVCIVHLNMNGTVVVT